MTTAALNREPADVVIGSTHKLEGMLAARYRNDASAIAFEVKDDAGFSATRSCDAIAIGLWPSRGCYLTGFELKVSRSDWLRELKDPSKAERFIPYLDFWYIVAGSKDIVRPDELPPRWGLLVPRGELLHEAVKAERNPEPKPFPRGMLASLVKRASAQSPVRAELDRARAEGVEQGKRDAEQRSKRDSGAMSEEHRDLLDRVRAFEAASGLMIQYVHDMPKLGAAVRMVMSGGNANLVRDYGRVVEEMRRVVTIAERTLEECRGIATEPRAGGVR